MVGTNILMTGVFIMAAVVQYNDPDMISWMGIYGAAAVASLLYVMGKNQRTFSILVLFVALIWAGFIVPEFFEGESFSFNTFNSVRMTNMEYETAREFGGLIVVAIWAGILAALPASSRVQVN